MSAPGRAPAAAPFQQFVARLRNRWQEDAAILHRRGAAVHAAAIESCVQDLENEARTFSLESLTLQQAADESGYSYSALEKMVRCSRVPNAGSLGNPRIRRGDLPKKPSSRSESSRGEPDLAELVLAGKGQPGDFS